MFGCARKAASALVLFDIDGTLLRRAGPAHRRALEDAIRIVAGFESTTDGIPMQGMLDRDILTMMLTRGGAPLRQVRVWMPELVIAASEHYEKHCPDLRRKTCPGARQFLRKLQRCGVPAALVTGNLSRIGWKKLERAGLKEYFRFGAFAEEGATRSSLVRLAIRKAQRQGLLSPQSTIALIGDHANDILAARANRIRPVAVATGLSLAEELTAHRPQFLFSDLRACEPDDILA